MDPVAQALRAQGIDVERATLQEHCRKILKEPRPGQINTPTLQPTVISSSEDDSKADVEKGKGMHKEPRETVDLTHEDDSKAAVKTRSNRAKKTIDLSLTSEDDSKAAVKTRSNRARETVNLSLTSEDDSKPAVKKRCKGAKTIPLQPVLSRAVSIQPAQSQVDGSKGVEGVEEELQEHIEE